MLAIGGGRHTTHRRTKTITVDCSVYHAARFVMCERLHTAAFALINSNPRSCFQLLVFTVICTAPAEIVASLHGAVYILAMGVFLRKDPRGARPRQSSRFQQGKLQKGPGGWHKVGYTSTSSTYKELYDLMCT